MKPILEIEHLSISFTRYDRGFRKRQLPVIRDLSLRIFPGQVTAVAGASGSGKSLLAHAILGILPYNSRMEGRIRYDGEELTAKRAEQLRGREISLIPQGVGCLDPLMKAGAQIRKGRRDAAAREMCARALRRFGLGKETEEKYPFELSGGMARRVLTASAVTESPRLIVADEPTPGLDAEAAARILGCFRELADAGAGILLITHDLESALTVADRVAVFYAGETIEEAAAEDFRDAAGLRHPFTRALWRAMPEHGFAPVSGAQPYPGTAAQGCPFAEQCGQRREACREAREIPLRPWKGGAVRCLFPEGADCRAEGEEKRCRAEEKRCPAETEERCGEEETG